ncbi:hypothetical protein QQ008_03310 [Fulvivirgaceae bacterium BMA10]|uniref:Uncharacterized protein n=1 Tax=Splendidivirga corallicola TaxID=3051826 RepID=A0ABT8KI24_9BACT|nr:hypothetical protein [Fulvivirgaceae bacterium BMA10]
MKKSLNLILIFLISSSAISQDYQSNIDALKKLIINKELKGDIIEQKFSPVAQEDLAISFVVHDTKRDKSDTYYFNLVDLDKNKIRFFTKKNAVLVEAKTKGDRKFIQYETDGKLGNYVNEINIQAQNIENAREIVNNLKSIAEHAEDTKKQYFDDSGNATAILDFLEKNIKPITINDDQFDQSFTYDKSKNGIVTFSTDNGRSTSVSYHLNFSDIDKNKISLEVKGNALFVEAETKLKKNYVKYSEDGAVKRFVNKVSIRAENIAGGKKLKAALESLKAYADENQKSDYDSELSYKETVKYLIDNIRIVNINDHVFDQSLGVMDKYPQVLSYKLSDGSKDESRTFTFNPIDLNRSKIAFRTKGTQVLINVEAKPKKNFIASLEGDQLDAYKNKFDIIASDIENAKALESAFRNLIKLSGEQSQNILVNGKKDPSSTEMLDFLTKKIGTVNINDDSHEQSFSYDKEKHNLVKLESVNTNDSKSGTQEVNLTDLDGGKIDFQVRGKEIFVEAQVRGGENFVKTTKNGEDGKYLNKLTMRISNIEEARVVTHVLRQLVKQQNGKLSER